MLSLTPTLRAAQQSASVAPRLRVRLFDRDVGLSRLRWTRWYSGSEPDGPAAAAVPSDDPLVRALIVGALMPELIRGRIIAFDAPSHTLTAQIAGSLATTVDGVPVSRSIGAVDLVVGRRVAIAQFDTASHRDAMVVGVY